MKKALSLRKPRKVGSSKLPDSQVYLTLEDLDKILDEFLDIRKIIDDMGKVSLEMFDRIMSHVNRHEGILMEMNGVTNFGSTPEKQAKRIVNGDHVASVLEAVQAGVDHLIELFKKPEE